MLHALQAACSSTREFRLNRFDNGDSEHVACHAGALPGVRLAAVEMPSASGRVQQQEVQDQRPALGKLTATTKEVLDRQQNLQVPS